ncbi:MAG TPA: pyridoxamine 5'-phosphate oxidase [Actinomycetota bacterium]|nr:pyridoxamine 5'-phosphate oxidase [Actinomycetota bacterium]
MSDIRGTRDGGLTEDDLGPDPIEVFLRWFGDARDAGILFPEAVALATADAQGRPAVRHVLVKQVDERGFTFFTNHDSRKGRHLAENPNAALAFLWREVDRQVCVAGTVAPIAPEESEAYFATRPREARLGAWASKQSRTVTSRAELEAEYDRMAARFPGDVPLPPHWGGYRLAPDTIEFWKGRTHRLHDRFRYTRDDASWRLERLWP